MQMGFYCLTPLTSGYVRHDDYFHISISFCVGSFQIQCLTFIFLGWDNLSCRSTTTQKTLFFFGIIHRFFASFFICHFFMWFLPQISWWYDRLRRYYDAAFTWQLLLESGGKFKLILEEKVENHDTSFNRTWSINLKLRANKLLVFAYYDSLDSC